MNETMPFILMVLAVFALMYILMLRPANKRVREQEKMQGQIAEGNRVLLTSGFFATVKAVGDKQLVVEMAPGVDVTIVRGAVAQVVTPDEEEFEFTEPEPEPHTANAAPVPGAHPDVPGVSVPDGGLAGYEAPAYQSAETTVVGPVAPADGEPAAGPRPDIADPVPGGKSLDAEAHLTRGPDSTELPETAEASSVSTALPASAVPPPAKKPTPAADADETVTKEK